jgi:hypothetical protein
MKPRALAAALMLATSVVAGARPAEAQIYRLRADSYFTASDSSTGLLVLSGESHYPSWLDAEAVVWLGIGGDAPGDVMVASVRARDPGGHGEVRAGRMLVTMGAIRPIHMDGADATARAPWGSSLEVFGGSPVAPAGQPRDFDWAVGGRLGQRFGQDVNVGLSYLQLRTAGAVAFEELGIDASTQVTKWLDGAFTGTLDLQSIGVTDARVSIAARVSSLRFEAFAMRRSPAHLLPATSLFAALGDVPSDRAGGSILWRPAPRLDVLGEGAIESLGGELGGQASLRTTLRLDARGDGALGLEVRRQSVPDASWTGVRGTARVPLSRYFIASTELEIARPDEPRGRGVVWPWGLVALRFKPEPRWEISGAAEASASPTSLSAVTGFLRVSHVVGSK